MDQLFQTAYQTHRTGDLAAAEPLYQQVLSQRPEHAEALFLLGSLFAQQGRYEDALPYLQSAAEVAPSNPEAWNNQAMCLKELGQFAQAEHCCRQAVAQSPNHPEFLYNLGSIYQQQHEHENALDCYQHVLSLLPNHAEARWNRALLLLLLGRFTSGWAEHECRFEIGLVPQRTFAEPRWTGEDLTGKTILVHAEQGAGDTLQFARYLALLKAQGAAIILQAPSTLTSVLQTLDRDLHVTTDATDAKYNYQIPLMSLPSVFGTELETIPAEVPYLHAQEFKAAHWQRRFGTYAPKNMWKVGIVWAGNPTHQNDHNRSCHLDDFAPLANIPGVALFSLQKGPAAQQAARPPFSLIDLGPGLEDFADTAAAIDNLDLVISVDTGVVHLAGAMGKPVWTLLPHVPDWRWMLERDDSPWYPTMRLFRQTEPRDWQSVFARVAVTLCNQVGVRCWESGEVQGALAAFLHALEREPDDRDTVLNCADVFQAFGKTEEAQHLLTQYLSLHENDTEVLERSMEYTLVRSRAA